MLFDALAVISEVDELLRAFHVPDGGRISDDEIPQLRGTGNDGVAKFSIQIPVVGQIQQNKVSLLYT